MTTESGDTLSVDEVLWVTRAGGPEWLRDTGLALDDGGFIRVTDTLQTETDNDIFAAGDIANVVNHPGKKPAYLPFVRAAHWRTTSAAMPSESQRSHSGRRKMAGADQYRRQIRSGLPG